MHKSCSVCFSLLIKQLLIKFRDFKTQSYCCMADSGQQKGKSATLKILTFFSLFWSMCIMAPFIKLKTHDSSESNLEESDDSDVEKFFDDDDSENDVQSDMEESELFSHTKFSNTIDIGKIIAIYSSETLNDPFFLCRVLEKGIHNNIFLMIMITFPAGTDYMVVNYLEKTSENF